MVNIRRFLPVADPRYMVLSNHEVQRYIQILSPHKIGKDQLWFLEAMDYTASILMGYVNASMDAFAADIGADITALDNRVGDVETATSALDIRVGDVESVNTAQDAAIAGKADIIHTQPASSITGLAAVATSGDKADVGLGNVDNTADVNKPVSTAQAAADAVFPADVASADVGKGADLVGIREALTSSPRNIGIIIRQGPLSARAFATGNGVTNDTAGITAWLTALNAEKRMGYLPEGEYLIDGIQITGLDQLFIEAHTAARIVGAPSIQNFAGNGATGQQFTVTAFNKTYGTIRVAHITSGGTQIPLTAGTHFSLSGNTITMLGANVIPIGDTLRAVAGASMLNLYSTGSTTARTGRFVWEGGYWDISQRGVVGGQASGSGLTINWYDKYEVNGATFFGYESHITGNVAGVADSGITALSCDNGTIMGCKFQGFGDLGIYATGGGSATAGDDGIGLSIVGNHFTHNSVAWKASRQLKNVVSTGNTYDRCNIGACLWPASNIKAGRGSITGERFWRCGRNAIDVRQQVGCVIANNVIIDPGYLPDGVTTANNYGNGGSLAAISLSGCEATKVTGNIIKMDELAKITSPTSYGIRNINYLFEGVTDQPIDNMIHDNDVEGMTIGIQENGSGTGSRYRNNEFRDCTTDYDGIPNTRLPYGSYTPTLTNSANITSSTVVDFRFRRHDGDYITVDFAVDIDPISHTDATDLRISLPVPKADPGTHAIKGTAYSQIAQAAAQIVTDGTNARMQMRYPTFADLGNRTWTGSFTYRAEKQ